MQPTYYVRHPDDTYSVAAPQPAEALVNAAMATLNQLGRMVGNSEHENNRIRAALTAALSDFTPLATPADAGAGLTLPSAEAVEQVRNALRLAMDICDAVPNRAHMLPEGEPLRHLGMLVNYQEETGAHGYAVIRDAKAAFEQDVAAIPKGAARSWNGTTYHNIEEIYHRFEDGEALHMWLDDQNVPRADADGKVFSLVGRVARLSKPTAQGTTQSIDTPELRNFAEQLYMAGVCGGGQIDITEKLIAHINRHIAAQATAARDAALEEAAKEAQSCFVSIGQPDDPHPDAVTFNGAVYDCARAIRGLKSHAAEQTTGEQK